jgi:hypothetical protein
VVRGQRLIALFLQQLATYLLRTFLKKALCAIAAQWNLILPAFAVEAAQFAVTLVVPNLGNAMLVDVAEDYFAAVIETAQRCVSIHEHGEGAP